MKNIIFIFAFLFLAACQDGGFDSARTQGAANSKNSAGKSGSGTNLNNTIIGGENVEPGSDISRTVLSFKSLEKPLDSQAGRQEVAIKQCTAAALTRRVVLTAAHCINADNQSYVEIHSGVTVATIPVAKSITLDEYASDPTADLALALLAEDLPENTITVSIPSPEMKVELSTLDLIAAGYGKNTDVVADAAPGSGLKEGLGVLRVVIMKISQYEFTETRFLVDQSSGKGFCQGDSGGPAFFAHNSKFYVMGVASKTIAPEGQTETASGHCSFRGAYVNLLKFKPWIETTTQRLSQEIASLQPAATAEQTTPPPAAAN
ncbi:trypsin-like serine protease [Bdellovibrio sp. HCB274]|uniref:trypsin-like serine protease n=1 Tax=Bdellovibrio sp. HCB274 TaxID=3394361 RepID=UPI0039B43BAE